mmetsp:Transcript_20664/g.58801  ORF Transcript_20664/g.58801 Transcript_20664/m.58801 type:complete len:316 (-) Transcript_20664:1151-2098(-)
MKQPRLSREKCAGLPKNNQTRHGHASRLGRLLLGGGQGVHLTAREVRQPQQHCVERAQESRVCARNNVPQLVQAGRELERGARKGGGGGGRGKTPRTRQPSRTRRGVGARHGAGAALASRCAGAWTAAVDDALESLELCERTDEGAVVDGEGSGLPRLSSSVNCLLISVYRSAASSERRYHHLLSFSRCTWHTNAVGRIFTAASFPLWRTHLPVHTSTSNSRARTSLRSSPRCRKAAVQPARGVADSTSASSRRGAAVSARSSTNAKTRHPLRLDGSVLAPPGSGEKVSSRSRLASPYEASEPSRGTAASLRPAR